MKIIKGDLIKLALEGKFDVVAHGCNCFCTQKLGLAKQMVNNFSTNNYKLESFKYKSSINKLGAIQYEYKNIDNKNSTAVVNCYTQYRYGTEKRHLDYEALTLCMRKINHIFKNKKVGLPIIGGGLAGGDKDKILEIYSKELTNVDLTVVEYDK